MFLLCTSAAVGFLGYVLEAISAQGHNFQGTEISDAFYKTILLFLFEGPGNLSKMENQTARQLLDVARYLAPLSMAGAIFASLKQFWEPKWIAWRMKKARNHTILLGSGQEAQAFIANSIVDGDTISVVVPSQERLRQLKDKFTDKVSFFIGQADELHTWECVAATQANRIILASSNDRRNLAAMKTIEGLAKQSPRKTQEIDTRVFVQISNNQARRELTRQTTTFSAPEGFQFEPFSAAELSARKFFLERDFFYETYYGGHERVHWLVFGFSENSATLLYQFLNVSPFPKLEKPLITIFTDRDNHSLIHFSELIENCREFVSINIIEDGTDHPITEKLLLELVTAKTISQPVSSILISEFGGDALELALMLRGIASRDNCLTAPIFLSEFQDSEYDDAVFGRMSNSIHDEISEVADLNSICCTGNLMGETDRLAYEFHQKYLSRLPALESEIKASHKNWQALDEDFRRSNRCAADHAKSKCEFLNFLGPLPAGPLSVLKHIPPSDQEIEALAAAEHDRWQIERLLQGWKYSKIRNDAKRHHPNLIPYSELDNNTKNYDRDQIHDLLKILEHSDVPRPTLKHTVNIGLIGQNQICQAERSTINERIKQEVLPSLSKQFPNSTFRFLTPMAPGSDLIIAELIANWIESNQQHQLIYVKTLSHFHLVSGYWKMKTNTSVWSLDSVPFNGISEDQFSENYAIIFEKICKDRPIIELYKPASTDKNKFQCNADYFSTRPDVLIVYCDQKRGGTSKVGACATAYSADAAGKKVYLICSPSAPMGQIGVIA